ncbi:hypothetical protein A2Z00_00680 [Candidatus Gottesmanbacteria bacterium RBG_13_45_10]|uniref:Uncharacterized protein n=1 Tax=Candidatus Gottesmanbacteria bacterium RBG_13_45_10 TaxID=1798370 RepID=A0A1F5ZGQ6_9BACT|nr:MAG: hypothetical protein A2Z00_00680 [Candidatus Gottesmanbacteria bacterium RBG_13_45_10]
MEILSFIIIGIASRLMPHPANMTAVGAMALFSGAKFSFWKASVIVCTTMLITDMVLGLHSVMWATYGSMILAVLIGRWIGNSKHMSRIIGGVLVSSVVFFVITNFAVWATTPLYPKTANGLLTCYIMALPFFRNSLVGDMFYTIALFSFEVVFASRRLNYAKRS